MALTIAQQLEFAWMSQASYLSFSGLGGNDQQGLINTLLNSTLNPNNKFAPAQATIFTDLTTGYSFFNHRPNTSSGFSATVFQSNADSAAQGYTIAVRGTEPEGIINSADLVEDALGVVLAGRAASQTIDAYRYYKQLTSTGSSNIYSQGEIDKLTSLYLRTPAGWLEEPELANAIAMFQSELQSDVGLGLIPSDATINFTGHSLGGHVAALLAELVAQNEGTVRIGDIVTYNAPGTNALVYEIENWFTPFGSTTIQSGILGEKHLAIIGEGGLEITAGLGQVNGTMQMAFIEDEALGLIANHSMVKLSDSMAVYSLFSTIAPTASIDDLTAILERSSNQVGQSLENLVVGLSQLVLGTKPIIDTDDRDNLYTAINDLTNSTAYEALIGKVVINPPAANASDARDNFGDFLSLHFRRCRKHIKKHTSRTYHCLGGG